MGANAQNRLKGIVLTVFTHLRHIGAAVRLFLVQVVHQRGIPFGDFLFVLQTGQRRMVDQRVQQRHRETALHAFDHFLRAVEICNQRFQLLAVQCRCAGVGVQRGAVHRDGDLILIHRLIIFDVLLLLAFFHLVERWLRDINMAALNDFRHLSIEEGQQQRTDVRTVDVGIGHDDDAVITQLVRVVLIAANAAAQRGDQRGNFLRSEHLIEARFLDVEDFTLQRQNRLILTVTALLR